MVNPSLLNAYILLLANINNERTGTECLEELICYHSKISVGTESAKFEG